MLLSQPLLMMLVSPWRAPCPTGWSRGSRRPSGWRSRRSAWRGSRCVGPATPLAWVVAALVVLGTGFGLFTSPNTNAAMGAVEPRRYGVASGFLGTMRLTGQVLSMAVAMLILSVRLGDVAAAQAPAAGAGRRAPHRASPSSRRCARPACCPRWRGGRSGPEAA